MEKKLPPLDSRWDTSIPNQTNPPTPNFDRNGAMGPNELETIAAIIPMGIPNQTNPPTPNFDRNGAMGPNRMETIAAIIPNPPTPNFGRNEAMGPNELVTIAPQIPNSPNPNFDRNGAMGRNELGTIATKILNHPTPNFDRNGAMGPNRFETIAAIIPKEPYGLSEERKSPPLYSQQEMEIKILEIQRLEKLVSSQGLQALGEKEMEKAKIASGYQNQVRFLNADLKITQEEAQLSKLMLKKSEEKFSKVSYFQNIFRHHRYLYFSALFKALVVAS
jgi:hypothetical protein